MSTTPRTTPDVGHRVTPPVPEPTGAPPVVAPAVVLALVLLALGLVGVRDALVAAGWLSGSPWTTAVLDALDSGVGRSAGALVVGILLALLGLWLVLRSTRRRPHTEVSLGEGTHAWLAPADVARVAALVASDLDGVVTARATGGRRSVALRVTALDTVQGSVGDDIRTAVDEALTGLDPQPRVRVKVSSLGGAR